MRKVFVLLFILGLVSISSDIGVAEDQNRDRTGTPDGSSTCQQCHNSGTFNPFISLSVQNSEGEDVLSYIPGDTLSLRFTLSSFGGPPVSVYGFQATALDSTLADAGQFIEPSSNVQLEEVNSMSIPSRHIIEHSFPSPVGLFDAKWIAPDDVGPIRFYYSGIAGNGNGGSGGDNAQNGSTLLNIGFPDALNESSLKHLTIGMNGEEFILNSDHIGSVDRLRVYDLSGRLEDDLLQLTLPYRFALNPGMKIVLAESQGALRSFKLVGH